MEEHTLLLAAATLFLYGLLARKIEQADITAPMLFTALGIACGPLGLNWISTGLNDELVMIIAEVTLAVVLFTDASQIRLKHLTQFERYPIRLLAIGLPLTIVCGALTGFWLTGLGWLNAIILAIILTPTDAALAQSVMEKKAIDRNLRHSINVESGLNDGIALPLLLLALALSQLGNIDQLNTSHWLEFISLQLILGTVAGVVIGRSGSYLINRAHYSHWISPLYQRLSSISIALMAFSAAELLQGNGFIAVFVAGLFMQTRHKIVIQRIKEFGEAEGELLTLSVFFIFGAVFIPLAWPYLTAEMVIYALFSLTLVRMLPVWLSLLGTGLAAKSKWFLAWFGPRGIASILYLLLVMQQTGSSDNLPELQATAIVTIALSVFLHGASTSLWIWLFKARSDKTDPT